MRINTSCATSKGHIASDPSSRKRNAGAKSSDFGTDTANKQHSESCAKRNAFSIAFSHALTNTNSISRNTECYF